jgi:hypothetical protein
MDKYKRTLLSSKNLSKTDVLGLMHDAGNEIARCKGYKVHKGIEAVHFFLVQEHHWTPAEVRRLSDADLCFLIAEEMTAE